MRRTLYLSETEGLTALRDGPSVWVTRTGSAGQRVPVGLVNRVVIIGNIRLDSGVITLFAENDIPVVFISRSGEEEAVVVPYNHRLSRHYNEQKVFLKEPWNTERYKRWAETKRMVIHVDVLKRLFKGMTRRLRYGLGEGNYQKLISVLKPDEERWVVVNSIVNNLFRGLIIGRLKSADLDLHTGVIHRRHNFGLVLDICYVMGGESDIQSVQFFKSSGSDAFIEKNNGGWAVTEAGMKNIIHRFENRREALSILINGIVDELFELMRELRT